jgi:hypothetical protein
MKEQGLIANVWSKVVIVATCTTLLLNHGSSLDKQSPDGVSVQYHEPAEAPHGSSPPISVGTPGASGNAFCTGVTLATEET